MILILIAYLRVLPSERRRERKVQRRGASAGEQAEVGWSWELARAMADVLGFSLAHPRAVCLCCLC